MSACAVMDYFFMFAMVSVGLIALTFTIVMIKDTFFD